MTVLPTSDATITPLVSPVGTNGAGPPLTLCGVTALIVSLVGSAGASASAAACDHQHASPVVWDSEAVDLTSPALNVRANRSANSGPVNGAGAGITQFGSSDFLGTGAQADYSTISGGFGHGIYETSPYATIAGGQTNVSELSSWSAIGGGFSNSTYNSNSATIAGGSNNRVIDSATGSVLGGNNNLVDVAIGGAIVGGDGNSVANTYGFIGAGSGNTNSGLAAAIVAGTGNTVDADSANSFVAAGTTARILTSPRSFIGTGSNQFISGAADAAIVAGRAQQVVANRAGILAGDGNLVQGANGVIGGGHTNQAIAANSGVFCGDSNGANAGSDQAGVLAGSRNAVTGAPNGGIVAGTDNTVTGASAMVGAGTNNATAAPTSAILCGTSGTIEAACTSSVIAGGATNQIKDDAAPGTKLLARSTLAHNFGSNAGVITGSGYATIIGGDGSTITGSPCSQIIGGVNVATLFGVANSIVGPGVDAGFATYSYGNSIIGSDGCFVRGNVTFECGIYASNNSAVGTAADASALNNCSVFGGSNHSIQKSNRSSIFAGTGSTIGAIAVTASSDSVVLGGASNLLGTVTAGVTRCAVVGGTTNAIQAGATNAVVSGGSANTITGATGASITGAASSTIASTGTNSAVVGGSTHAVSAPTAGVFAGTAGTIEAACTSSVIAGGATNQIKDDPAPGTKLYARSKYATIEGSTDGIITGSDYAAIIGTQTGTITGSTSSVIIGGSRANNIVAGNSITGSGFDPAFAFLSFCNIIAGSYGNTISGDKTFATGVYSSASSTIGSAGVNVNVNRSAIVGSQRTALPFTDMCVAEAVDLTTIGNNLITQTARSFAIGGTGHLVGTGTAGVSNSGILGGNGNAVQNAATNCTITGGASNLITNCTSAHIGGGTSNTITTTATNAVIGGGSSNSITTSTGAGIFCGASNTIGANSTNAVVCGGNTNNCTAVAGFIGGGQQNFVSSSTFAGIVCGDRHTISSTSQASFIGGGTLNTITSATQAGIVNGTSCSIASGCTNAHIGGGNTNAIGATAACTAAFIGAGNNNVLSNGANSSAIAAGSTCTLTASTFSFIGAGSTSVINGGAGAFIGAGNSCSIGGTSSYAAICAGASNGISSTSTYAFIGAGATNTIAGATHACVVAGSNNAVASGAIAAGILCGIGGNATMQTQDVLSGGYTASVGERQRYELVLRGDTPGSVAAETVILKFGVAAGAPTQEITLVNGKTYTIKALVGATQSGAANVATSAGWEIFAKAYCTGGVVTVVQTSNNLPAVLPGGLLGSTITFSGSGTTLRLTAAIAGGTTLATKWTADVIVVETLA